MPCPAGFHVEGDACVADKTPATGAGGTQAPPAPTTCPADRPVGTPPNCCPRGREPKGGNCVSSCPPGYKVLDAPNKYGSFCEGRCSGGSGRVRQVEGRSALSRWQLCVPGRNRPLWRQRRLRQAGDGGVRPAIHRHEAGLLVSGWPATAGLQVRCGSAGPGRTPAPVGPTPKKCVQVPGDCLHYRTVPGSIAGKVCDKTGPPKLDCSGGAASQPK